MFDNGIIPKACRYIMRDLLADVSSIFADKERQRILALTEAAKEGVTIDNGKLIFTEGNKIPYGQDFGFPIGVPANIPFTVSKNYGMFTVEGRIQLTAPGYGDHERGYGNGAIYVYVKYLPELVRKELVEEVEHG